MEEREKLKAGAQRGACGEKKLKGRGGGKGVIP